MIASGWVWLIAAFVLAIAETVLPGFILLGFAIGAAITAVALFLGLLGGSIGWILLVFAVGSAIGWVALRKLFTLPGQKPKIWRRDINEN